MSIIEQGFFGKLPVSDEFITLGLSSACISQVQKLLTHLPSSAPHRIVCALADQQKTLFALTWPSVDALGREHNCFLAAVEEDERGAIQDPWQHPWFLHALGLRKEIIAMSQHVFEGQSFSDELLQICDLQRILPANAVERLDWQGDGGNSRKIAVDQSPWLHLDDVLYVDPKDTSTWSKEMTQTQFYSSLYHKIQDPHVEENLSVALEREA